jgi:two-component system response regulator AtoC
VSDIPDLVGHFLQKINFELGTKVSKLQQGVMDRLMTHPWTGNVRELENTLVEAVVRARGKVILLEEIEKALNTNEALSEHSPTPHSLPDIEKEHIQNTLEQVNWNRTRAASILGISPPTLRKKIRKFGLNPAEDGRR